MEGDSSDQIPDDLFEIEFENSFLDEYNRDLQPSPVDSVEFSSDAMEESLSLTPSESELINENILLREMTQAEINTIQQLLMDDLAEGTTANSEPLSPCIPDSNQSCIPDKISDSAKVPTIPSSYSTDIPWVLRRVSLPRGKLKDQPSIYEISRLMNFEIPTAADTFDSSLEDHIICPQDIKINCDVTEMITDTTSSTVTENSLKLSSKSTEEKIEKSSLVITSEVTKAEDVPQILPSKKNPDGTTRLPNVNECLACFSTGHRFKACPLKNLQPNCDLPSLKGSRRRRKRSSRK